nr:DUF4058 family protein [Armatimonas sp.]
MPSPFPGMDPYLESRTLWPDVHNAFIVYLRAVINRQLPPGFSARVEERLVVEEGVRHFKADVSIGQGGPASGGATLAEVPSKFMDWVDDGVPVRQRFIEIQSHDAEDRRVLTVIELLSHSNKSAGRGRDEYLAKQKTLLESEVHLLEIDLLRASEYTLAASQNSLRARFGPFHYAASLHRGGYGQRFQAVAWTVQDRLPTVLVPLDEAHPDIEIDLQLVFERTYDEGGFDRMVDYAKSPEPALADETLAGWVASMSASCMSKARPES